MTLPPARPRSRIAVGLAVVAGLVGSAVPAAATVAASAAWAESAARGRLFSVADVPPAPVALVFGAALNPDGTPSPFLAYRLQVARELFDAGRVRVLLVSGDNGEPSHDEPTAMRTWLIEHGVPAPRIVRDYAGFDTYATCYRAVHVFGVRRAVLVSQTYHLPRALAICRSVGVDAVGVGTDTDAGDAAWRSGQLRELPADVKAVLMVATRARPRFPGPPDDAVAVALAAGGGPTGRG